MPRSQRLEFEDAWYHVLDRGANHQQTFLDEADYKNFLSLLAECHKIWALETHAYCLIPNHYHLLVKTPRGNLSSAMRHLNGVYTQRFNKVHQRDGALFRGRYKAILVDADSYLLQVARYVHLNPVKAKLVQKPEDYNWSSYRFYLNPAKKPYFLHLNNLLDYFGKASDAPNGFQKFTVAGIDEETQAFYEHKKLSPIFGNKSFIEKIKNNFNSSPAGQPEIPQQKELLRYPPSIDEIIRMVSQAFEVSLETLLVSKPKKANEARNIAIYLCRTLGGWPLGQITKTFGNGSVSAVGNVVYRIKESLEKDKELKKRIKDIEKSILDKKLAAQTNLV